MIRRRLVATVTLAAAVCAAPGCASRASGDETGSAAAATGVVSAAPALWEPMDPAFTGCEGG